MYESIGVVLLLSCSGKMRPNVLRSEALWGINLVYEFIRFTHITTLPETNIGPENGWLGVPVSFWDGLFSGAMLVLGSVYMI